VSRGARLVVLLVGLIGLGAVLAVALAHIPRSGSPSHPYGDRAVRAAISQQTSNVVSSVNFDQRGLDTLGEELVFFSAVLGATAILRPGRDEASEDGARGSVEQGEHRPLDAVRLIGYVLVPVTVLVGLYVVAHGNVSPGGGFQGGIVLGTAVHLVYLAGSRSAIDRARPEALVETTEALGAGAFLVVGLAGLVLGGSFLENVLPKGTLPALLSSGTVEPLNIAVGLEVAAGVALVLGKFLEQLFEFRTVGAK
jgi:multicomponent Na+:H+ antiporter subunit B